jgi:hypothetical protein
VSDRQDDGLAPAADAASRMVDDALREPIGYSLPAGFADRVALRARKQRKRFDWFENVVVPVLLAAPVFYLQDVLSGVLQKFMPGVGDSLLRVLDLIPRLSIDGIVYAVGGVLFSGVADRLMRRRTMGRMTAA